MKKTVVLEQEDIDDLRDTIFNAIGTTENLTNEKVLEVWNKLPDDIKENAIHWGLNDTVVGDKIYEWIIDNGI
jgi:hypothetical protein